MERVDVELREEVKDFGFSDLGFVRVPSWPHGGDPPPSLPLLRRALALSQRFDVALHAAAGDLGAFRVSAVLSVVEERLALVEKAAKEAATADEGKAPDIPEAGLAHDGGGMLQVAGVAGDITDVAFSSDELRVLLVYKDSLEVHSTHELAANAYAGSPLFAAKMTTDAATAVWSPTDPLVFAIADGDCLSVITMNADDAHPVRELSQRLPARAHCVAWHPNGRVLAVALSTGAVALHGADGAAVGGVQCAHETAAPAVFVSYVDAAHVLVGYRTSDPGDDNDGDGEGEEDYLLYVVEVQEGGGRVYDFGGPEIDVADVSGRRFLLTHTPCADLCHLVFSTKSDSVLTFGLAAADDCGGACVKYECEEGHGIVLPMDAGWEALRVVGTAVDVTNTFMTEEHAALQATVPTPALLMLTDNGRFHVWTCVKARQTTPRWGRPHFSQPFAAIPQVQRPPQQRQAPSSPPPAAHAAVVAVEEEKADPGAQDGGFSFTLNGDKDDDNAAAVPSFSFNIGSDDDKKDDDSTATAAPSFSFTLDGDKKEDKDDNNAAAVPSFSFNIGSDDDKKDDDDSTATAAPFISFTLDGDKKEDKDDNNAAAVPSFSFNIGSDDDKKDDDSTATAAPSISFTLDGDKKEDKDDNTAAVPSFSFNIGSDDEKTTRNDDGAVKCKACETPNPDAPAAPSATEASDVSAQVSAFSFAPAPAPREPAGDRPDDEPADDDGDDDSERTEDEAEDQKGGAAQQPVFAPPSGWECQTCLVQNDDGAVKCKSCETPNPDAPAAPSAPEATDTSAQFSFGPSPGSGDAGGGDAGDADQTGGFSFSSLASPDTGAPPAPSFSFTNIEHSGEKDKGDNTATPSFSFTNIEHSDEKDKGDNTAAPTFSFTMGGADDKKEGGGATLPAHQAPFSVFVGTTGAAQQGRDGEDGNEAPSFDLTTACPQFSFGPSPGDSAAAVPSFSFAGFADDSAQPAFSFDGTNDAQRPEAFIFAPASSSSDAPPVFEFCAPPDQQAGAHKDANGGGVAAAPSFSFGDGVDGGGLSTFAFKANQPDMKAAEPPDEAWRSELTGKGKRVDAQDKDGMWHWACLAADAKEDDERLLIHYLGSDLEDEWISRDSPRLAKNRTHSDITHSAIVDWLQYYTRSSIHSGNRAVAELRDYCEAIRANDKYYSFTWKNTRSFGVEHCAVLATELLQHEAGVTEFDLVNAPNIGDEGVRLLVEAALKNKKLKVFKLENVNMSAEGKQLMAGLAAARPDLLLNWRADLKRKGDCVDARDKDGMWWLSCLAADAKEDGQLLIHYLGSGLEDEWISRDSPRLAENRTHSMRAHAGDVDWSHYTTSSFHSGYRSVTRLREYCEAMRANDEYYSFTWKNCPLGVEHCRVLATELLQNQSCNASCVHTSFLNVTSASCKPCPTGLFVNFSSHTETTCNSWCPPSSFFNGSMCVTCPAGRFVNRSRHTEPSSSCSSSCPPDAYLNTETASCTPCPSGYFVTTTHAQTACSDTCALGSFYNGSRSCIECSPGRFSASASTTCTECGASTYQPASGASECKLCDGGTFHPLHGQTSIASCSCALCPPGRFFNTDRKGFCDTCAPGRYTATQNATECTKCERGRYTSLDGSPGCTLAERGFFINDTGLQEPLPCARGYFTNTTGSTSCHACSPGHTSLPGSDACTPCGLGQYASLSTASSCAPCALGRFANVTGSTRCQLCSPGRFASGMRSTECSECAPGSFANTSVQATCQPCDPGRFANTTGATKCIMCQTGRAVAGSRATTCSECAPGSFANTSVQATCQPCDPGRFANTTGATTCVTCQTGRAVAGSRATTCAECAPGTFSNSTGLHACHPCAAGRFTRTTGRSTCDTCSSGSFTSSPRSSSCSLCGLGRYSNASGLVSCAPCPRGRFANHTGLSACVSCPVGTDSSDDREGAVSCTSCSVGRFSDAGVCKPCAPGRYSDATSQTACVKCDAGHHASLEGSVACIPCALGRFSNQSGLADCFACPAGTIANTTTLTDCFLCPAGRHSPSDGSARCLACDSGKFASSSRTSACALCPVGRHAEREGSVACSECPRPTYTEKPGERYCSACPLGRYAVFRADPSCEQCPSGASCVPGRNVTTSADVYPVTDSRTGAITTYPCTGGRCEADGRCGEGRVSPASANPLCGG